MFFVRYKSFQKFDVLSGKLVLTMLLFGLLTPLLGIFDVRSQDVVTFGLSMAVPALVHAFVVYHGDPMEITRHAISANLHVIIALIILWTGFLDSQRLVVPGFLKIWKRY